MLGKLGSIALATLMIAVMVTAAMAQEPQSKRKTDTKQTSKVEGWVKINGGPTVFLRPDIDAYEHNTGLVRDMRTGQRSRPITPESLTPPQPPAYFLPQTPVQPYAVQPHAIQPYAIQPYLLSPTYEIPRNPYSDPYAVNPYRQPWYDMGPGNVYAPNRPCNNCGSTIGSPGAINQRWQRTTIQK